MSPYPTENITSGVILKDFKSKLYYLSFQNYTQHNILQYISEGAMTLKGAASDCPFLLKDNEHGGALTVT